MAGPFITDRFLLQTDTAARIYEEYARGMPILDYHCHLPPDEIAADRRFENLTRIWLAGDHYKWRAMRACGVDEALITGDASDREKFDAWAATVPKTLRNPLYHWTHLELARYFGITDRLLSPATAQSVWEECNAKLATDEFTTRSLIRRMNVAAVCTTDDPIDTLEHHAALAADPSFPVPVLPAFRPDKAMAIADPDRFNAWVDSLGAAATVRIDGFDAFLDALDRQHAFFHEQGCRLSDHGVENVPCAEATEAETAAIFARVRAGELPSPDDQARFAAEMLYRFGVLDHGRGWVQQFHLGAMRNNSRRMFERLGPDTGYDSIGDFEQGRGLARLLDRLDRTDQLAPTILYNLNPRDNAVLATMIGNFQDGRTPGKMQFGSGWWFLDQKDGMEAQIEALSNMGVLSRFVGMLTDSRSFLSYPRHEYFRRVLSNLFGNDIEQGRIPRDLDMVGEMMRDICYRNAARYFRFPGVPVPE